MLKAQFPYQARFLDTFGVSGVCVAGAMRAHELVALRQGVGSLRVGAYDRETGRARCFWASEKQQNRTRHS